MAREVLTISNRRFSIMQELSRQQCKVIREQLSEILKTNGIEGLELSLGNATFDADQVAFKLVARRAGVPTQEEKDLHMAAKYKNIDVSKIVDGYRLVGFKTRARKRPYIAEKNGARYVLDADYTERLWAK
jgi:hypothetical protein